MFYSSSYFAIWKANSTILDSDICFYNWYWWHVFVLSCHLLRRTEEHTPGTPTLPQIGDAWRLALEAPVHRARCSKRLHQAGNPGHSLLFHPSSTPPTQGKPGCTSQCKRYQAKTADENGTQGNSAPSQPPLVPELSTSTDPDSQTSSPKCGFMDHKGWSHWRNIRKQKSKHHEGDKTLASLILAQVLNTLKLKVLPMFRPCSISAILLHLREEKLHFSFYYRGEFLSCRLSICWSHIIIILWL